MKKTINIGLIGWGTVGGGLLKILKRNQTLIEGRLGGKLKIKAIADKDIATPRSLEVDKKLLTTDINSLFSDPEIDIIVELIGGIEPAKTYILAAIKAGKHVVTANKALLAECGEEIFKAAQRSQVDVYYEASVGGGMPIIKILREGLSGNRLQSILGIINGTANYILSQMSSEGKDFSEVLDEARSKGYAEANPAMDIEGTDSAHKLALLATLAFGTQVKLSDVYVEGIKEIIPVDICYGRELGYVLKLLAIAKETNGELEVRVHPTFIARSHPLASVEGVFNACFLSGDAAGDILVSGEGAGELPAGSAVVADIVDLGRNIISGAIERIPMFIYQESRKKIKSMQETVSRYYLRFSVVDKPGVLAAISSLLGEKNISIASVIQKERSHGEVVPIIIMTHEAREEDLQTALAEINKLGAVKAKTIYIRVEG